jgi:hypothetical protein
MAASNRRSLNLAQGIGKTNDDQASFCNPQELDTYRLRCVAGGYHAENSIHSCGFPMPNRIALFNWLFLR